ncbi:peptidoglycan-binding protein [Methanobrevibacter sp.]
MYCLAPLSALDLTQDDNNKYIGHDNGDSSINTKDVDVAKEQNDRQNKKLDDGNSAKEVDTDSIDNNNQDNVKSDNVKSENVKSDNVKAADDNGMEIGRANPKLTINVNDVQIGQKATAEIHAVKSFSGTVYVYLDNSYVPKPVSVKNGYGKVTLNELPAGKYSATVKYYGGLKYKADQSSTTFKVSKFNPNLKIDVDDVNIGEKATAKITADKSFSGIVHVYLEGSPLAYDVYIKNGYGQVSFKKLSTGTYTATVKYAGSIKYEADKSSTTFSVNKFNPNLKINVDDIDYGEKATVKITADKSFSGTVYVSFHGDLMPHKVYVKNGYGKLTIDEKLAAGKYSATVKFAGDKKFSPSQDSTRFTVHRLNPNLSIHVDDLKVGKNEIVTLKADKDFSGYIYVSFHGDLKPHKIYMKNGYAQWSFEEYLAAGKYVATAKFNGDEKFKPCQASTTFTVSKYNPNLSIDVDDIDYGEKAIVRITADESFNGTVYVSFHGDLMPHKVYVKNGHAELTIDEDLLAGKYLATVKFAGDKKFSKSQDSTRFIVRGNPDLSINVDNIDYGEKATAEISANKDFSGYVYVSFHGDLLPHKVFVKNGYAKVTIDEDLVAGNYTATVKFAGNKKFTQSQDSTRFTVRANLDPNLNIKVDDIYQGQKAVVVVTANETLNGEANIKLNNSNAVYPINITNGYASITLDENLTPGDYLATVTLFGDDTFKADESSTTFKVKEVLDPKLNIKVKNIGYGDKETVTVTTDAKFTGNVDVKIGTKNYNVKVVNGKGTIDVSGLKVGTYTAIATFKKTETFNASTKTAKFTVKKVSPKITANSKTFKYAQKTKSYSVSLKDNKGKAMKGQKVTLKVNGKTYSAKTNSKGVATFKITKLNKVGNNNAVITYAGDKSYNKVSKKAKITVKFDTLAPNSKNKAMVKELQRALKRNHFYIKYNGHRLLVDGWYHIFTTWAVKKYQKAKGLKVTGKVDYKTALKLKLI